MNKKRAILIIVALTLAGFIVFYTLPRDAKTQAEAIYQAEQYRPKGACGMAMTPATHLGTGAKYTFNSTCLAPGWVPDSTQQ